MCTIWYKRSTEKILQDYHYSNNYKDEMKNLKIYAAKGEYESIQVILTPTEDIHSISVKLTSDNFLNQENVKIYLQKYILVSENSPHQLQTLTGFYPDALLPFDVAVKYKEDNIKAHKNQGIWLTVFIPDYVTSGCHNATLEIKLNNKLHKVPFEVEVWDFNIGKQVHIKSDYVIGNMGLFLGEHDTSKEMYRAYVEKLIEFRLAPHRIAHFIHKNAITPEAFIEELRYLDAPNKPHLSTIVLPIYEKNGLIDEEHYEMFVEALAAAAVQDQVDYFERAAAYLGFIDEPHLNDTWDKTNNVSKQFEQIKEKTAQTFEDKYLNNEFAKKVAKSMRNVGNYVTCYMDEKLPEVVNWSPHFRHLHTQEERDQYKNTGKANWCYTCGGWGDVPSLTIDHKLIDARLIPWIQDRYGFEGSIYWDTTVYFKNIFCQQSHHNHLYEIDSYQESVRVARDPGDGYIFYPGRPYGVFGPIETIRLHALRDGNEDYEYLYLLRQIYSNNGKDANHIIEKLHAKLYLNVTSFATSETFENVKIELAKLILDAQKGIFYE